MQNIFLQKTFTITHNHAWLKFMVTSLWLDFCTVGHQNRNHMFSTFVFCFSRLNYRFRKKNLIKNFKILIKPESMNFYDHQLSNCEIWTRPGCSSLVWPLWYRTLYSVYAIKFWQFVWPSIPIGMKSFQIFYSEYERYFVV